MKTKKLLDRVKALLGADERAQLKRYKSLKKVLAKLAKKEVALRRKLDGETDKRRRRELRRKLKVVAAQRAKGAKLIAIIDKRRAR